MEGAIEPLIFESQPQWLLVLMDAYICAFARLRVARNPGT